MRPIEDLTPYARNARTHPPEQVDQIAASMERFGFTIPVLVAEDGTIIAGHGRILAANQLGVPEVPVMVARGWSDEDRRLYTLADNRLAETSEWDPAMLRFEWDTLLAEGAEDSLSMIGFSQAELDALIPQALNEAGVGLTDPDDVPEADEEQAVSQEGDVWLLGGHRIACGSCTDEAIVEAVLAGEVPHLMVTDPPYGVNYDPSWRAKAGVNKNKKKMGKVLNDDKADWRDAWALFKGDVAYVWHASLFTREVLESLEAAGFRHRSMIIWSKDRFTLGRGDYHWQHEPAWYCVRDGKTGHYIGGRSQSTVWNIPARDDSGFGHGTQKPVECMKRPIENNSEPGDAVYEPFSGSGTTIIAAEMTGRRCLAIELNPAYVDVAVKRWQDYTGEQAILEKTGESFAQTQTARLGGEPVADAA